MAKRKTSRTSPVKKVRHDFSGECQLRQLPSGSFFRIVRKDGSLSRKTYLKEKGSYDSSSRKYVITECDDVWGSGIEMKGTTKVSTKFTY